MNEIKPEIWFTNIRKGQTEFRDNQDIFSAFNFGPGIKSNKNVEYLVNKFLKFWEGSYKISEIQTNLHEANYLYLSSDKARNILSWESILDFENSIELTANWYKDFYNSGKSFSGCIKNINEFQSMLEI